MLYKHLVKYVTVGARSVSTQPYIQLKEAMKNSANSSFNRDDGGAKPKPQHGAPSIDNQGRGQGTFKKQLFSNPQQSAFRAYQVNDSFTPLKPPIQVVFEAIKSQPWPRRPEPKPHDPSRLGTKDYCSFHDRQGHRVAQCWFLQKYLEDLVQQGYLQEYILVPGASSETERQRETPSPN